MTPGVQVVDLLGSDTVSIVDAALWLLTLLGRTKAVGRHIATGTVLPYHLPFCLRSRAKRVVARAMEVVATIVASAHDAASAFGTVDVATAMLMAGQAATARVKDAWVQATKGGTLPAYRALPIHPDPLDVRTVKASLQVGASPYPSCMHVCVYGCGAHGAVIGSDALLLRYAF